MSIWKQYMHIARLDTEDVEGILEMPTIFIMPKIDGANASIFLDDSGKIRVAKRTAVIGENEDFRGMYKYVCDNKQKYVDFFAKYPDTIIYAEWMIKHSIGFYRSDAWNKLYAYDILNCVTNEFYSIDLVVEMLKEFSIEMVVPTCKMAGPLISEEATIQLEYYANNNKFLIDEKDRVGEGIVIKAFDKNGIAFKNKFGRTVWAKIVRQEFKELNTIAMGINEKVLEKEYEKVFAELYITSGRVEKCKQKIITDKNTGWQSQYIGELLGRVYYDAFEEELWKFLKDYKVKSLNFSTMQKYCIIKTKEILGL